MGVSRASLETRSCTKSPPCSTAWRPSTPSPSMCRWSGRPWPSAQGGPPGPWTRAPASGCLTSAPVRGRPRSVPGGGRVRAVPCDFTLGMPREGKRRLSADVAGWRCDATRLRCAGPAAARLRLGSSGMGDGTSNVGLGVLNTSSSLQGSSTGARSSRRGAPLMLGGLGLHPGEHDLARFLRRRAPDGLQPAAASTPAGCCSSVTRAAWAPTGDGRRPRSRTAGPRPPWIGRCALQDTHGPGGHVVVQRALDDSGALGFWAPMKLPSPT
ncbi:hypothetical protein SANTM175S_03431 [Streptomyces antimycoticus]